MSPIRLSMKPVIGRPDVEPFAGVVNVAAITNDGTVVVTIIVGENVDEARDRDAGACQFRSCKGRSSCGGRRSLGKRRFPTHLRPVRLGCRGEAITRTAVFRWNRAASHSCKTPIPGDTPAESDTPVESDTPAQRSRRSPSSPCVVISWSYPASTAADVQGTNGMQVGYLMARGPARPYVHSPGEWRNGRRWGLKSPSGENRVWVRVPPCPWNATLRLIVRCCGFRTEVWETALAP